MTKRMTSLAALSLFFAACDGEVGPAGAQGPTGMDGADGTDGLDGADGMDAICADATPLEITGITGLPEETVMADMEVGMVTVQTNSTDVELAFVGSDAEFESDGNTFSFTPMFDGSRTFTVIASDGCTTDVEDFTVEAFFGTAMLNVVNLYEPAGTIDLIPDVPDADELVNIGFQTQTGYFLYDAQTIEFSLMEDLTQYGTTGELVLMDGAYTLVVYGDANGDIATQLFEDDLSEPGEGDMSLTVSHFASSAGQVDLLDDGSPVVSDLDYGATVGPLSVPATEYAFGLDVDDDGTADLEYESQDLSSLSGESVHAYAYDYDGYTFLFISYPEVNSSLRLAPLGFLPTFNQSGTSSDPQSIPDAGYPLDGAASSIFVPDTCRVADVAVDVDIEHGSRGDLVVVLAAPDGQQITLWNGVGGDADDLIGSFDTDRDDLTDVDGELDASSDLPETTSIYSFAGAVGQGFWTLSVFDDESSSTGTLNSWGLTVGCR